MLKKFILLCTLWTHAAYGAIAIDSETSARAGEPARPSFLNSTTYMGSYAAPEVAERNTFAVSASSDAAATLTPMQRRDAAQDTWIKDTLVVILGPTTRAEREELIPNLLTQENSLPLYNRITERLGNGIPTIGLPEVTKKILEVLTDRGDQLKGREESYNFGLFRFRLDRELSLEEKIFASLKCLSSNIIKPIRTNFQSIITEFLRGILLGVYDHANIYDLLEAKPSPASNPFTTESHSEEPWQAIIEDRAFQLEALPEPLPGPLPEAGALKKQYTTRVPRDANMWRELAYALVHLIDRKVISFPSLMESAPVSEEYSAPAYAIGVAEWALEDRHLIQNNLFGKMTALLADSLIAGKISIVSILQNLGFYKPRTLTMPFSFTGQQGISFWSTNAARTLALPSFIGEAPKFLEHLADENHSKATISGLKMAGLFFAPTVLEYVLNMHIFSDVCTLLPWTELLETPVPVKNRMVAAFLADPWPTLSLGFNVYGFGKNSGVMFDETQGWKTRLASCLSSLGNLAAAHSSAVDLNIFDYSSDSYCKYVANHGNTIFMITYFGSTVLRLWDMHTEGTRTYQKLKTLTSDTPPVESWAGRYRQGVSIIETATTTLEEIGSYVSAFNPLRLFRLFG